MKRPTLLAVLVVLTACVSPNRHADRLAGIGSWAIQLQGYEREGALDRLARASVDLLVVDRLSRGDLARLRESPGRTRPRKLVLVYVNVGQAETYRDYWSDDWRAPTSSEPGRPRFLLAPDPDGWPGNYTTAYWDLDWQKIVLDVVRASLADGYDGVFFDWVAGWSGPGVGAAARTAGVDPARAMVDLVGRLAAAARRVRPDCVVLANDAAALAEARPELLEVVDGVVQESVLFAGESSDTWDDPRNADAEVPAEGPWSTTTHLRRLDAVRRCGRLVLTLDYATSPENVRAAVDLAIRHRFVPFVSRTPLDRLPPAVFDAEPGAD